MIIKLSDQVHLDLTRPPYVTEGLSVAVLGNKGAGKSNTMAVMAEEAHAAGLPFVYFDPNGDAASLCELGSDVILVGDPNHDEIIRRADYPLENAVEEARDYMEMVLKQGYSLVVDLTEGDSPELSQMTFQSLINEHFRQAGKLRTPAFVFVDEAHQFAPQSNANKLEKLSLRAIGKVASDGRKRGMMLVVATQRATFLSKRILFGVNVRLFGKITYWPDYDAIRHYLPPGTSFEKMRSLRSGEIFIVSEEYLGVTRVKLRQTTDLGKTPAIVARPRQARPNKAAWIQLPLDAGKEQ